MHLYTQIYEFAASAGALEGYVYHKTSSQHIDMTAVDVWTANLVEAYSLLPENVVTAIQPSLDLTFNRAISSLSDFVDRDHKILKRLVSMVEKKKKGTPDDFQKVKWFQEKL